MQPRKTITLNPITIGIGITATAFIILLIISIGQLLRPSPYGPSIRIDNLDDHIKNLPTDRRDSMQSTLYETIEMNLPKNTEMPKQGALIRSDSVTTKYNENTEVHYGSFIVDIDSISQSYDIQYEWSSKENNPNLSGYSIIISCLPEQKLIYNKFECRDMINAASSISPYDTIQQYLPYHSSLKSGEPLYIQKRQTSSGSKYLEVNVNSCGNTEKIAEAKQIAETWTKTIGIDPEKLTYQYRDLCDGDS